MLWAVGLAYETFPCWSTTTMPSAIASKMGRSGVSGGGAERGIGALLRLFLEEPLESIDLGGVEASGATGKNAAHVAEGLADMHALAVDGELADVLVVHRAAHLEDGQSATHLPEQ